MGGCCCTVCGRFKGFWPFTSISPGGTALSETLGWGEIGLRAGGGGVIPAPFPDPPPFWAPVMGTLQRADRGGWGGGGGRGS